MMKKIIIAANALKHSLTVLQSLDAITLGLQHSGLQAELIKIPLADGGNGTLDAFMHADGERVIMTVDDPLGRPIEAAYGLIDNGQTAVIEMALASGLELISAKECNPLIASTFGTGQMMQAALAHGIKRMIIGLGGSATVDGGMGALAALGVKFLSAEGDVLTPRPDFMHLIADLDTSGLDARWQDVEVIIASDVDNPVLGERGAAAIFAPQKGASPHMVKQLEAHLTQFFNQLTQHTGRDVQNVSGAGAAGALAGGLMSLFPAKITSGIDLLLDHVGFRKYLQHADFVITSEGKLDEQTLGGKGPLGIAKLSRHYHVPCVVLVGSLAIDESRLRAEGVSAVMPIVDSPMRLEDALHQGEDLLYRAARRLGYLLHDTL
jgi:glycerate kinase